MRSSLVSFYVISNKVNGYNKWGVLTYCFVHKVWELDISTERYRYIRECVERLMKINSDGIHIVRSRSSLYNALMRVTPDMDEEECQSIVRGVYSEFEAEENR